ncbi:hypothetical protein [Teredinibacter sp. KSP-S5-2]|uniref:hypothetical protein n=1 Tax=Teredinibacter sp. KSP-S5-2 TaxID=3034506 RepID=UPI0029346D5A|nr:hypothetical protein [Teredinibacter sp. KSP-S5-2]WNO10585.1 hypothetical protein P5V12_05300 [Teredinibacter sp. KSP-S5-2]
MEFNWLSFLLGISPLVVGLLLNLILDLRLSPKLIFVLSKMPTRSIYRDNPPNLRGEWDVYWASNSIKFENEKDRHKTANIYQFSKYIYAEYAAVDQRYQLVGIIEGSYITGTWYNKKDRFGYRGAFQLRIVDSKKLEGRWLGYSSNGSDINTDTYTWNKNPD